MNEKVKIYHCPICKSSSRDPGYHGFYQLNFRICNEGFTPDRTEKILSGDDRAIFEGFVHGEPRCGFKGSGFVFYRVLAVG